MSHTVNRIFRKIGVMHRRFLYERVRPRLSPAEINRRMAPGVGIDVAANEGFSKLLAYHLGVTPHAPGTRAGGGEGERRAGEVDWHREDHFGVVWPRRFVGATSDLLEGSDLVLLWHKNKMQYLLDVAARYEETGESAWSEEWFAAVDSWCRQNPFMVGLNWRSPMETGTRLVMWSQSLARLKGAALPAERVCERIVRSVVRQAEFLAGHFSAKEVPNNHLIGEAATLHAFAAYWPEFRDAEEWMRKGEAVLLDEARRQVLGDGMQYEVAVNYHLYVIDFYLLYLHAKRARGETPPAALCDAVAAMLDAALALVSPSGRFPSVGDDSITEFLALDPSALGRRDPARPLLAREMVRPEYARVLDGAAWGKALLDRSSAVERAQCFAEAGIAAFRTGSSHVVFTCGPQHGRAFSPGHLHADMGSFELEVDGTPLFIDSGTYLYTYDRGLRDHFRSAAAHNTVVVDDVDPARPARSFDWEEVPRGTLTGFGAEGSAGFVSCERAIPGAGGGVFTHRRALVFVGRVWIVVDEVFPAGATPEGEHVARALFHTPFPRARVASALERKVSLSPAAGAGWIVDVASPSKQTLELLDGETDRLGLYSRFYGDLQAGTTIRTSVPVGERCALVHVVRDSGTAVNVREWTGTGVELELIGDGRSHVVLVEPGRAQARLDGAVVGRRSP